MRYFDYSLIKYSPDPRRGEVINIGLVVFKEQPEVHMLATHNKLRLLDGESGITDIDRLRTSFQEIAAISKEPAEQSRLLESLGSSVTLSPMAYFSIERPEHYKEKVAELFSLLVKPPFVPLKEDRQSRIVTRIKHKFKNLKILANDPAQLEEHKVVQNFELSDQTGLKVDFLLKNGSYHVTEAIDFNLHKLKPKYNEATMKTLTFIESKEVFNSNVNCYLAYAATAARESEVQGFVFLPGMRIFV